MSNIPTPHIACTDPSLIAETVLMPGDPLRAKFIAETFLTNVKQFNHVRNILGYTGYYNGKKISVMASGMGMPSIGIYSYELYAYYDVECIVRIGSAGSFDDSLEVFDTILVTDAYSDSTFAKTAFGYKSHILKPSAVVNNKIKKIANKLDIKLKEARIYSSDAFYSAFPNKSEELKRKYGCMAVEMESFALFANAKYLGKKAACILTISDSSKKKISALEREKSFTNMMKIALELAK